MGRNSIQNYNSVVKHCTEYNSLYICTEPKCERGADQTDLQWAVEQTHRDPYFVVVCTDGHLVHVNNIKAINS